ncbi:hypothetical protein [Kribbella swartbergensis]
MDTFAAVQLEGWTGRGVEPAAELSATRRGRLLFAELEATPHVHRRMPRQIREADAMFFQAVILTMGAASLDQDGRIAQLSPGDLAAPPVATPARLRRSSAADDGRDRFIGKVPACNLPPVTSPLRLGRDAIGGRADGANG